MSINTKLLINIIVPIIAILAILFIMTLSIRARNQAERKNMVALSLVSEMAELNQRMYYYLLYQEDRAKREWFSIYGSLLEITDEIADGSPEETAIVARIRQALLEMRGIFSDRLTAPLPEGGTELFNERQARLSSQLLVRARSVSLDAHRLYQMTGIERRHLRSRTNTFILLILLSSLLITLATLVPINRKLSRSISTFTTGARIIGAGNLDHRIAVASDDEIGRLSQAFNVMTASLKAITVSRDDLAREMAERKRAEEALARSEAILAQAGQMAHLGAWQIEFSETNDINVNPLHWSDEVYRIFGYEPGAVAVTNDLFFERVHPDDRGQIREAVAKALATESPYSIDHRIVRPDGEVRNVLEHGEITFGPDGKPVRIIGAVQDITERTRAEEALRRSETLLAEAERLSHTGAWVWDVAADRWMFSDEWLRIHGVVQRSLAPGELLSLAHPDDRAVVEHAFSDARAGARPYNVVHRIIRQDTREVRVVRASGQYVPDPEGRVVRVYGFAQDITDQKRAEEALRESEARLRLATEGAGVGIWSLDLATGSMMWDVQTKKLFGFGTDSEINEDVFLQAIHPDDRGRAVSAVARAQKEGVNLDIAYRVIWKDGSVHWLLIRGKTRNDARGSRMDGTALDITVRKQAELDLELSKQEQERYAAQLETIFNNLTSGLVVSDLEGKLFRWNPAAVAMHGFASEEEGRRRLPELTGIFELSTEKDGLLPLEMWPLSRIMRGETLHDWEVRLRKKGVDWRRIFSYSGTLARDREGNPLLAVVIVTDITERKRQDEEFRRISRQNELILQYAGEGIFGLDLNGRVTFVNAVAAHMLGFGTEELRGSHSHTTWHYRKADGSDYPSHECPIYAAYHQGSIRSGEEVFWRKDGTPFPIDFTSRPIYEDGTIRGAVVVYRDITERKRAEEELRGLLAELERSNKELEQFAYVASHDLQEPLRMVASYVQLFERKYKGHLDPQADKYVFFAVDGVKRMQKLIDGLLAYSRVARGAQFAPVDVNKAFELALSNLMVAVKESNAVVTRDDLPMVLGDEIQLAQLFQNLLANALKFRKPGTPPRVHVSVNRQGKTWIFSVTDNGIGIDQKYAERIFLIFQRLHSREEYPGTGIGLSLCKRIIERHGGRIWVVSEPGKGSVFFFTIPKRGMS